MLRPLVSSLTMLGAGRRTDVQRETVQEHFARTGMRAGRYETVHAPAVASNPLPRNVVSADCLPGDRGWWGFSFRDVPRRPSGETFIATIPDCTVTWYRDPARAGDFYPAILTGDGRALDMRELRFRPAHAGTLRRAAAARFEAATWVIERVYHNHSHWLTAHLPKLLLLKSRAGVDGALLPAERTSTMDGSLGLLGIQAGALRTFGPAPPIRVRELTVVGTDRFRPELLQPLAAACGAAPGSRPFRRVFISRARASRRRLLNEDDAWRLLASAGFERVCMETLTFDEQVRLMHETAVLAGPHGAGLTNMLFCPPGTQVIEIADLGFPNPNFYALASALDHHYWLVQADSFGDCHPLQKDLRADMAGLADVMRRLPA